MNSSLRFRRISSRDDWAAPILSNGSLGEPSASRLDWISVGEPLLFWGLAARRRPRLTFSLGLSSGPSLSLDAQAVRLRSVPRISLLPLPLLIRAAERRFRVAAFPELWE